MTLEERIMDELRAERAAVPAPGPRAVPQSQSRSTRRWVGVIVAVLLASGAALGPTLFDRGGAVADGPDEVAVGPLVVPVTGETVAVGGVTMDVAAPGPPLDPAVELPGVEVPLDRSGAPGLAALPNDTNGPMVYLGTVAGQAIVLHDDYPPVAGIGEELVALLDRIQQGPMFCTNSDGCSTASGGPLMGLGHSRSGNGPSQVTATGFDLPPETAVVIVTVGGGHAYWQRPAGNSVTIRWEQPEAPRPPFTFTGLDQDGDQLFQQTFE